MPWIDDNSRKWWVLAAISGVLGLVVLDETVVGVALTTIRTDLDMSPVAAHWVVNAYMLSLTCLVAVGGRLGDTLGHRTFFVVGAGLFGVASLMAGFAPDGVWLIAARAVQGVGAAIIFPASIAMMTGIFPPEQRGTAFGVQITIAGTFMALGPLVGGFFSEIVTWRWIFWINLPVVACIALIVLAAWKPAHQQDAPTDRKPRSSFDGFGLITLVAGLTALVIALMQGTSWGWESPAIVTLLCGGAAVLLLFSIIEIRRSDPLIELRLLRIATFTGGNLVFFMFQFSKVAVFVFVALYLQNVMHTSPIDAGIAILVAILPTLVTSLVAGKLVDRLGSRRPLLIGLLLNATAVTAVGLATAYKNYALIVPPLIVWGATLPLIAVSARLALMGAAPKSQQGQASGVNSPFKCLAAPWAWPRAEPCSWRPGTIEACS